jgi:alpha-ketoglutarate-dependent taurine dioxygenase
VKNEDVLNLYGRIESDLRHESQKVLLKQDSNERLFSDWTMAYQEVDELSEELISSVISREELVDKSRQRKSIDNERIREIFIKFRFKLGK